MATSKALVTLQGSKCLNLGLKCFSTSCVRDKKSYKLVVVGGGAGGCSTAAKFASQLGKGQIAVIEPCDTHYYQPLWTLVGAGLKKVQQSAKPMKDVLPKSCDWIKDKAVAFDPDNCTVTTESGELINYEYLVVAMGLQLNYHHIKGLPEAFDVDDSVVSNYSKDLCSKTFPALQNFTEGNAIFTFPNSPVKCAGGAQKAMYMAEHYFRKAGKRDRANIMFNTPQGVLYSVKKYADSLLTICRERDIAINYKRDLIEVRPDKKEAVFAKLDSDKGETETMNYSVLHIVPPMSSPDVLSQCKKLVNDAGFLNVNQYTLQHMIYPNIFGIGDCTNVPTSKTVAAAATMGRTLEKNLAALMDGQTVFKHQYDGYTSCPFVTGYGSCILAEFDFDGQPLETFPFDQSKERRTMYHVKKDILPAVYWHLMLTGYWNGPKVWRQLMHLGFHTPSKAIPADTSA